MSGVGVAIRCGILKYRSFGFEISLGGVLLLVLQASLYFFVELRGLPLGVKYVIETIYSQSTQPPTAAVQVDLSRNVSWQHDMGSLRQT